MFAQYSPLFTSGLLESSAPVPRSPPARLRKKNTVRDSLPVSAYSASTSFYADPHNAHDDSAIFLTLMPRRNAGIDEDRSFLSLDLAESQSMRSMSLRRKDTVTTRATTYFGRPETTLFAPTTSRAPSTYSSKPPAYTLSFALAGPSRRNPSREASRLPSPKPVPSSSLPELPQTSTAQRRPPKLRLTLSTVVSDASSSSFSPMSASMHRPSHSAPSLLSPALLSSPLLSPREQSYFQFSPTTTSAPALPVPVKQTPSSPKPSLKSPVAPVPAPSRPVIGLKASPSMRSTASHHTRQVNRSAALAALEGRSGSASPRRGVVRPRNFMSMTDDEDEADDQMPFTQVLREAEDVVLPPARPAIVPSRRESAPNSFGRTSGSSRTRSSRRGTIESFLFPLANFIDFKDDDGSTRSWRSFVEIS